MEKSIAFMFDIAGTTDRMDEKTAKELIKKIEELRNKFNADVAYICFSTLYDDTRDLRYSCSRIKPFLTDSIKFGIHFYACGKYDYDSDQQIYVSNYFNGDKIQVFYDHYVNNMEGNQFVALFDDSFDPLSTLTYQDKHPFFCGIPYNYLRIRVGSSNLFFMYSDKENITGVLEMLDNYICAIKNVNPEDILEKQKNIDLNLTINEIESLIACGRFDELASYLNNAKPDNDVYKTILIELYSRYSFHDVEDAKSLYVKHLVDILENYFNELEDDKSLETLHILKTRIH